MIKRFLVPALALAAFGLPAVANIVEYCSGSGCGATTQSAFNNVVALDSYTYQGLETFNMDAELSGSTYTDSTTGIIFQDFQGNALTVTGGTLSTPFGDDAILITIPNTILAISLTINVTRGLCDNYCTENETTGFLGFINPDSPTGSWTVGISPTGSGGYAQILNFNAAGPSASQSDTPEVGTLLLIGAGLISMRWMKRLPRPRFLRTPQTV